MAHSRRWQLARRAWGCTVSVVALAALLAAGCGGGDKEPAALSDVTIDTTPESGAAVTIDGLARGVSPLTLTDLAPGFYEIIAKKDKFTDAYERIQVKGGAPERFEITIEPFVGYLTIDSNPDGADVLLNGEVVGKTPIIQKSLRVGKHTYEVKLANHYPESGEVDIERNYKYEKNHTLKPIEGAINVVSRPTGGLIHINNELQAQTTPAKFTLAAGTYLVAVWAQGYVQEEQKVVVEANQTHEISLNLKEGNIPQGMVLIPAGEFVWGAEGRAPDEAPRRKQELKAFYIDKYEVTNQQFKEVFPEYEFTKGQELYPATGVSWNQAMKYAQMVGKRLPTEAEWEKAARGTDGREFPWGDAFEAFRCNSLEAQLEMTTRVGQRLEGASPFGVMDMAGNVAEWTFDWYDRYPGNRDVAKDYGQVYRVLRGGGFSSEKFDVRCARRAFDKVDSAKPSYGFRCAKDAEEGK